ncbi:MAG: VCBS repeat-containing protein [Myxococcales bacterium]|nr:VCBS repeat-containing protein [Myxococcales bacterium]
MGSLVGGNVALGAEPDAPPPVRVLVLPFRVQGEGNLGYLRSGVRDVLASRLYREGSLVIADEFDADEARAILGAERLDLDRLRILGRQARADYTVYGSVTAVGAGYSLDANALSNSGDAAPRRHFTQGDALSKLIPSLGPLAEEIGAAILADRAERLRRLAAPPSPPPVAAPLAGGTPDWVEKTPKTAEPAGDAPPNEVFLRPDGGSGGGEMLRPGVWRSEPLSSAFVAVAVGDVDLDGAPELVAIDRNNVWIYGRQGEAMDLEQHVAGVSYHQYLNVEVADTNGNRTPEIIVTNVGQGVVNSFVLEWNEGRYERIATRIPYLLRVVEDGRGGSRLVGQKLGPVEPFGLPIHELGWRGTRLVEERKLAIPHGLNVFDFHFVTPGPDTGERVVGFAPGGEVRLYEGDATVWESGESYDGSLNAFSASMRGSEILGKGASGMRTIYLSGRLIPVDLDGDGRLELLVRRNESKLGNVFEKVRVYDGGRVHALNWNGTGFAERWRTPYLDGYVSDFRVADFDGDRDLELVIAIVKDAGITGEVKDLFSFGSADRGTRTVILSYDLAAPNPSEGRLKK